MDWKEIGVWVLGVLAALAATGFVIKVVFRGKTTNVTNIKTTQKGNIVGGNLAGRDNVSDNKR